MDPLMVFCGIVLAVLAAAVVYLCCSKTGKKRKHGAKPGDLIEIFRDGYQHWGVCLFNDMIVHFSPKGDDKKASKKAMVDGPGVVLCENVWDVIGDSDFKVNNHLDDKYESRKPETIVKEARGMVGKELQYSLTGFNCEHFATNLRYGHAGSRQRKHGAKPGDLIEIFRKGYQHWGVYVGDDKIVHFTVHISGDNENAGAMVDGPGVFCENIWKVIGDCDFKVNNQLDDEYESRTPETIVKKACGMVGEKRRYCLYDSNCEHFATDLRYGKAVSRQVKDRPVKAYFASFFTDSASASVSTSQGSNATATSSSVSDGAVSSKSKVSTRRSKQD